MLLHNLLSFLASAGAVTAGTSTQPVNAASCYGTALPTIAPSKDNRTVPWGSPSVHFSSLNGSLSTCCDSLDQIRDALDDINHQLYALLNQRAAYVREATRFKPTRASVNVPSRNQEEIQEAAAQAAEIGMPVTIAQSVMKTILDSSVPFEQCISLSPLEDLNRGIFGDEDRALA